MALQHNDEQDVSEDHRDSEPKVSSRRLAFYVGAAAFFLAPIMVANWAFAEACFRDSISHFYYSRFTGDVLVGTLFFIGFFLFAYIGRSKCENRLSKVAGMGALGVALFPVSGTGCEGNALVNGRSFISVATDGVDPYAVAKITTPQEGDGAFQGMFEFFSFDLFGAITVPVDAIHFLSAAALLGSLIYFCFFLFTQAAPDETEKVDGKRHLKPGKAARNKTYRFCGWCMTAAVVVILANSLATLITGRLGADQAGAAIKAFWTGNNIMFFAEWVILFFFGVSWAIKSRMDFLRDTWVGRMLAIWLYDDVPSVAASGINVQALRARKSG